MLEKLIVVIFAGLLSFFPGCFVLKKVPQLTGIFKLSSVIGLSWSIWMLLFWIAFTIKIPVAILFWGLLSLCLLYSVIYFRSNWKLTLPNLTAPNLVFGFSILFLVLPFIWMTIPPGCDVAMHGYISRLIVNSNGLPLNYDPFLPDSPFGGYSAGYQALTALIAGLSDTLLHEAINLISLMVYAFLLINICALYACFMSIESALSSSAITLFVSKSILTTIHWGGNPTIISLAFCLSFVWLVIQGIKNQKLVLFLLAAFSFVAVPITHAIPAVTMVYLCVPVFAILFYEHAHNSKWMLMNLLYMGAFIILLIVPFAINFHNVTSPELIAMIRDWQFTMMGNTLGKGLWYNIKACMAQVTYRAGDPISILCGAGILSMVISHRFKPLIYGAILVLGIFLLVLNSAYWILPFSEILYPERVLYFLIVLMGIPVGYLISSISSLPYKYTSRITVSLVLVLWGLGLYSYQKGYALAINGNNKVVCGKEEMLAFEWANTNTETNAIFTCTYADIGMWIPTFSNRATIGTHIHFIHEVTHRFKALEKINAPKYYWVTVNDIQQQTPIISTIADKTLVFHNPRVYIYR